MTEPRDRALEALYERETSPEFSVAPDLGGKAATIVNGVLTHLPELDALIEAAATDWRLARMPVVDRSVLRIGVFELVHRPETPTAVILNEAVRLAKTYSTARSGGFVNGVLGSIAGRVRARTEERNVTN